MRTRSPSRGASPGYTKTRASTFESNQVKRITMYLDGHEMAVIRFPKMTEAQGVFTVLGNDGRMLLLSHRGRLKKRSAACRSRRFGL